MISIKEKEEYRNRVFDYIYDKYIDQTTAYVEYDINSNTIKSHYTTEEWLSMVL